MKKFAIFCAIAVAMFSFSSCDEGGVKDHKKTDQTLYAVSQDSSIVIYRHESVNPIVLDKPISVDKLKQYGIPYSIIESLDKNPGMHRYVEGKENDKYQANEVAIGLVIGLIVGAGIALLICMISLD